MAKRQNSITFGEIVQCQNMAGSYEQDFVFCSFDLKIIGESGSGMIYNDEVYAFDTDYIESGSAIDTLTLDVWPVEVWIILGILVIGILFVIVRVTEDM